MPQDKFGRNYELRVESTQKGEFFKITLPKTVEFSLTRHNLGSSNNCNIRVTNLGQKERNNIRQDWSTFSARRIVQLNAGYGENNLPLIFSGIIQQAWSYREGVDFITNIDCNDGAFPASLSRISGNEGTFPSGTPIKTVYENLINLLDNTSLGLIGNSFIYDNNGNLQVLKKSKSFSGNVMQNLINISGQSFFIDNGIAYVLTNNEWLKVQGQAPIISVDSGLLNTPLLETQTVTFDMIFEPSLKVGQLIQLQSELSPQLSNAVLNNSKTGPSDNYYKITSLRHKALISPAICGDAITNVEFYAVNSPIGGPT